MPNPSAALTRAWCVTLLRVISDAYQLGDVLCSAALRAEDRVLQPQIMFVPREHAAIMQADAVVPDEYGPALVIDVDDADPGEAARAARRRQYAAARVLECWELDAAGGVALWQADAEWRYARVEPDAGGVYYSAAAEELFFPLDWLRSRPPMWDIMTFWAMIDA